MISLSYVPIPRPFESPVSLLYRCLIHNGYHSAKQFRNVNYWKFKHISRCFWKSSEVAELISGQHFLSRDERQQILNGFFGITRGLSRIIFANINGVDIPADLLRSELSLCPICIREEFIDITHLFKCVDICRLHGTKLLQACPSCHIALDWLELSNYTCSCGFDLRFIQITTGDPGAAQIIGNALKAGDSQFFKNLLNVFQIYHPLITTKNESLFLSCIITMARGRIDDFFQSITRMQSFYPSLHCSTLLAPALSSTNKTLVEQAKIYYAKSSQTRPTHHSPGCDCSELAFIEPALKYIIPTKKHTKKLFTDGQIKRATSLKEPRHKATYKIMDLCEVLWSDGEWSKINRTPRSDDESPVIYIRDAAKLLQTTIETLRTLVNSGAINSHRALYNCEQTFDEEEIRRFTETYVLSTDLSRRAGPKCGSITHFSRCLKAIKLLDIGNCQKATVYLRSEIPDEVTKYLELDKPLSENTEPNVANMCNITQINYYLPQLNSSAIAALFTLGLLQKVIRPAFTVYMKRRSPRLYATRESVLTTVKWLEPYQTIVQLTNEIGCSRKFLTMRFIKTKKVRHSILGRQVLIHVSEGIKIKQHVEKYITAIELRAITGLTRKNIQLAIVNHDIEPLNSDHPDYIPGLLLFFIDECNAYIQKFFSQTYLAHSASRIHH